MNKKLLPVLLIVVLILATVGCASCVDSTADKLREINMALLYSYSNVELKVVTHTDDADLHAKYVMTTTSNVTDISYEVERINEFDVNGEIPSEYISTVVGTAVFDGNAITSIDGEELDQNILLNVVNKNMAFRLSYFGEIKAGNGGIETRVVDPKGFLQNSDFDGEQMTVSVKLVQSYLSSIIINYVTSDGAQVSLDYTFTR